MATTGYGSTYVSGTDLVANYPAASLLVAQGIDSAGYYIGRGINAQTVSYQTVLTDAGKTISMTAAGATTLTIPANSSVAYVVGSRINILNLGAGACTPTAAAGVTINGTITALATNSSAAVIKTATNTWSYVPFGSGVGAAVYSDANTGTYTGYAYKTYTGSGTITITTAGFADILIIGGGGGGGGNGAGGAGAGGYAALSNYYLPTGTLTITVGAGGAISDLSSLATTGNPSIINTFVATGGTQGYGYAGRQGGDSKTGSGNGGAGNLAVSSIAPSSFLSIQGSTGGAGLDSTNNSGGGGGGGAGGAGAAATSGAGGAGGIGAASSITGSSVTRGGGGGGGARVSGGTGGTGGGGNGGVGVSTAGTAGSANTGGGGGSGGRDYTTGGTLGGAGGSGIVIVRVAV